MIDDPNSPERSHAEEPEMNASSQHQPVAEPFDDYDDAYDDTYENSLPQRPRASYLTPLTALLMALILGGVGFYVGIRVEKSKTTTAAGGTSGFARAFAGIGTGGSTTTGGTSTTGSASRTGFPGAGAGGFASRFAAGGPGGAGGTVGSISSVRGNTIYVTETSGNTVKVKLSSATKITKSESVSRKKLYPGEEVVVAGSTGAKGTVSATSVTDSGASSTASGSGSSASTSGSTSNSSSSISSLFGGG